MGGPGFGAVARSRHFCLDASFSDLPLAFAFLLRILFRFAFERAQQSQTLRPAHRPLPRAPESVDE